MYIQAHVLSGWIAGNYLKLNARERFFCMIAGGILDVDGLGILISQDAYDDYHHILGHNLLFGLIVTLILTFFSSHKKKCFFHLSRAFSLTHINGPIRLRRTLDHLLFLAFLQLCALQRV